MTANAAGQVRRNAVDEHAVARQLNTYRPLQLTVVLATAPMIAAPPIVQAVSAPGALTLPWMLAWSLTLLAFAIILHASLTRARLRGWPLIVATVALPLAVVSETVIALTGGLPPSSIGITLAVGFAAMPLAGLVSKRYALTVVGISFVIAATGCLILIPDVPELLSCLASLACGTLLPSWFVGQLLDEHAKLALDSLERQRSVRVVSERSFTLGPSSSTLTQLDHDAEALLRAVGDGSIELPPDAGRARHAAQLATDLRQHLLTSRRATWLVTAIGDSSVLGSRVSYRDPGSAAARLLPKHRSTVLSLIWLLLTNRKQLISIDVVESTGPTVPVIITAQRPIKNLARYVGLLESFGEVVIPNDRSIIMQLDPYLSFGEVQPHGATTNTGSLKLGDTLTDRSRTVS